MPRVILMQGLPASGKTTFARSLQWQRPGLARVSLDDLRVMLHPGPRIWHQPHEPAVHAAHDRLLADLVAAGRDVVVDGTHLTPPQPAAIARLLAPLDVVWQVVSLTAVPVQVCVDRDAGRATRGQPAVGERVIRDLAREHAKASEAG